MFATIFASVAGLAKDWLQGRRDDSRQKRELKEAVTQRKTQLILDSTQKDSDWELAALADKDRFARRLLMLSIISPVIITAIAPAHGERIWKSLEIVPPEYWSAVGLVLGFYFAFKNAPEVLGKFAEALRKRKPTI